jgi:CHASE3 domain sensor protein
VRLSSRVRLLFVALFSLLIMGVASAIFVVSIRDDVAHEVASELHPAREELNGLLTALVDQETAQRGYLLTGDESFLEDVLGGRARTATNLERLGRAVAGRPTLLAAVERIGSRVEAWQQLGADFEIEAKRSGSDEVVQSLVASGTGARLFDEARDEIAAVRHALLVELRREEQRLDRLDDSLTRVGFGTAIAAVVLLGVAGRLFARWLTRPLTALRSSVRRAASGALHDPITATGPPDLLELATDVDAMRRRLLAEVDDAARARAALADRGMIVVTLRDELAPTETTLPDGIAFAGRFRPAKGIVAGDWYDVVRLDHDRLVLALVDVSGHGAEVATFALRTKALTMAAIGTGSPGEVFDWLAANLGETGELFLTGVLIEVDAASGRVRYASAGHPPLLLAGLTGVQLLEPTGPLLGPLPGTWTTAEAQLDRGGVIVAYSDGLIDARSPTGDPLGLARVVDVIADAQLGGADAVADTCIDLVEGFAAEHGRDDITLCVLGR